MHACARVATLSAHPALSASKPCSELALSEGELATIVLKSPALLSRNPRATRDRLAWWRRQVGDDEAAWDRLRASLRDRPQVLNLTEEVARCTCCLCHCMLCSLCIAGGRSAIIARRAQPHNCPHHARAKSAYTATKQPAILRCAFCRGKLQALQQEWGVSEEEVMGAALSRAVHALADGM